MGAENFLSFPGFNPKLELSKHKIDSAHPYLRVGPAGGSRCKQSQSHFLPSTGRQTLRRIMSFLGRRIETQSPSPPSA